MHSHSDHSHTHSQGVLTIDPQDHKKKAQLTKVFYITFAFMLIEFVGGWVANSLAVLSDAVHMMTDVATIGLGLFIFWVSRRPRTPRMSFGYFRAEILGALASGLLLWFLCGLLIFEALQRLQSPPPVNGPIVFWIGLVGMGVNGFGMYLLKEHHHENINIRAAYLHIVSDFLGSVGALITGLVLWLTGWLPIDPILTILFTVLILQSSWRMIREAIEVLMQKTPKEIDPEEVLEKLQQIEGVEGVHDLHIWAVTSGRLSLSVHLSSKQQELVLSRAKELLLKEYRIDHTTIQIENPEIFNREYCCI